MTFTRIILAAVAVIIVGGFAFLALTDVSIEHSQIQKTIPNDRFLKNH